MKSKLLNAAYVRRLIPHRPLASYKGKNGHVLLIAGSRGMTGAAILSALGALKVGSGLITVGLPKSAQKAAGSRLPEAMTLLLPETSGGYLSQAAINVIKRYVRRRTITTFAVGPGISVHPTVRVVTRALIRLKLPLVLDADGLNNMTAQDLKGHPMIITPHAGELAKLLSIGRGEIEKNRLAITIRTAKQLSLVCILKGHKTIISDGTSTYINTTGNPAMATGGMGDVLTGIIAGLLAQGLSLFHAACAGVYLHGLAGDLARVSDRGLLATELAMQIPYALKKIGIR